MLVNHGAGWSEAGDFRNFEECKREAALYAAKHSAQAGCTTIGAAMQWREEQAKAAADSAFKDAARSCAAITRVEIVHKPGGRATVFGTSKQRFAFDKCMAEKGQPGDWNR